MMGKINIFIKKYRILLGLLGMLGYIGLFYFMNTLTPLYVDDYNYSFSFATGEKIKSFLDILYSQKTHYNILNGRCITHTIAQFFLLFGKPFFNIINTITFFFLGIIIYFLSIGTFENIKISWMVIIYAMLFILPPAFGESFLWLVGASNYLYGILLICIFLIPYRRAIEKEGKYNNKILFFFSAVFNFIFGMIAGWTNENNSVALVGILFIYIFVLILKKEKIHLWMITGLIGALCGGILMLISPGERGRLQEAGGIGTIIKLVKNFICISCAMFEYLFPLLVLLIFLIWMCFKTENVKMGYFGYLVIIGFFLDTYSMIVTPYFPERAWTGPIVFLLIGTGYIYNCIAHKNQDVHNVFRIIVCFMYIVSVAFLFNAYSSMKNTNIEFSKRNIMIEEQKKEGKSTIEIPSIRGYSKYDCYSDFGDLSKNSNEWPNTIIAKYYGVEKIILREK